MKVDIDQLMTVTNYGKLKDLTRQHVYRLIQNGELTMVEIDGIKFLLLDKQALDFQRKRVK